jgi:LacI family transcriptional regulator
MSVNRPVSLKSVAEKAGVSRMTVSLALRDDVSISVSTREKIKKIAAGLGYKANPRVAKAMAEIARSGHTNPADKFIFLTSDLTADIWKTRHHVRNCYQGALRRAQKYGYTVEPVWALDPKLSGGKLSRMLWAQGIEGVLIPPLGPGAVIDSVRTLDLDWKRFSVVALDESMDTPVFHCARHDHFNAMLLLLHSLENQGYRRIGFFMSRKLEVRTRHRWYAAYLLWRNMRGFQHDLPAFIYDELDEETGLRWIEECKIDAIVGSGTSTYENLCEMGVKIPSRLGLAVLNSPDNYERIALSGIDQTGEMLGETGVDMLVGMIHRGEKGIPETPSQRICEGVWVRGRSTRKNGPPMGGPPLIQMMLPLSHA